MQYVFLFGGIVVIILAIQLLRKFLKLRKHGMKAEACVVSIEERRGDEYTIYAPSIAYYTHHPFRIIKDAGIDTYNSNEYKIGDKIEVIYDPDDPEIFVVNKYRFGIPKIVAAVMLGLILIAISVLIFKGVLDFGNVFG